MSNSNGPKLRIGVPSNQWLTSVQHVVSDSELARLDINRDDLPVLGGLDLLPDAIFVNGPAATDEFFLGISSLADRHTRTSKPFGFLFAQWLRICPFQALSATVQSFPILA